LKCLTRHARLYAGHPRLFEKEERGWQQKSGLPDFRNESYGRKSDISDLR